LSSGGGIHCAPDSIEIDIVFILVHIKIESLDIDLVPRSRNVGGNAVDIRAHNKIDWIGQGSIHTHLHLA